MNFVKVIRNLVIFGLFVAFCISASFAIIDLVSARMGYSVSFQDRKEVSLPSFTFCPFDQQSKGAYEATNLQNLTELLVQMPLTLGVTVDEGFR